MIDRPSTTDETYRRDYLTGAASLTAAGTVAFAGCLGDDGDSDDPNGDPDDTDDSDDLNGDSTGTLATQVTDQPGDIADFESCLVTIDGIWVKSRNGGDADDAGTDDTESDATDGNETDGDGASAGDDVNDETDDEDEPDEPDEPDEADVDQGEGREYHELDEPQEADLVDLQGENTQLLGEHELAVREYEFLQLDVSDVVGTLEDGETAAIETPGNAPLQFTERFEIREDERTTFVADFTPVRRGQSGSYIIQPVARGTKVLYGDEEYELANEDDEEGDDGIDDESETDGPGPADDSA